MKHQRRFKRHKKRLEAEFRTDGEGIRAIASRFSETGLFLRTQRAFKEGTEVEVRIYLSDEKHIDLKGIVKYARRERLLQEQNGMGIEITEKNALYDTFIDGLREKD